MLGSFSKYLQSGLFVALFSMCAGKNELGRRPLVFPPHNSFEGTWTWAWIRTLSWLKLRKQLSGEMLSQLCSYLCSYLCCYLCCYGTLESLLFPTPHPSTHCVPRKCAPFPRAAPQKRGKLPNSIPLDMMCISRQFPCSWGWTKS